MSGGVLSLAERVQPERDLRNALVEPARKALNKPGAVVMIGQAQHVTITALAEIAGLIGVSIETSEAVEKLDPMGYEEEPASCMAHVVCTVTRPDGVSVVEHGFASAGETTRGARKWADWHALASMAGTRAKVRALTTMLMPVIAAAGEYRLEATPAEVMPDYSPGQEPFEEPT